MRRGRAAPARRIHALRSHGLPRVRGRAASLRVSDLSISRTMRETLRGGSGRRTGVRVFFDNNSSKIEKKTFLQHFFRKTSKTALKMDYNERFFSDSHELAPSA